MAKSNADRMRAYRQRRKDHAEAAFFATRIQQQRDRDRIAHLEARLALLLEAYTASENENRRLKKALFAMAVTT